MVSRFDWRLTKDAIVMEYSDSGEYVAYREYANLEAETASLREAVKEWNAFSFQAFCAGYEKGSLDIGGGFYSNPSDYPEEWEDIKAEILNNAPQTGED